MTSEAFLDEIKRAETESANLIESAEKKKRDLVEKAKKDALKIIADVEKEDTAYREKVFSDEEVKLDLEKQKLVSLNESEIKSFLNKAESKVDSQSDFLFKKFNGEIQK